MRTRSVRHTILLAADVHQDAHVFLRQPAPRTGNWPWMVLSGTAELYIALMKMHAQGSGAFGFDFSSVSLVTIPNYTASPDHWKVSYQTIVTGAAAIPGPSDCRWPGSQWKSLSRGPKRRSVCLFLHLRRHWRQHPLHGIDSSAWLTWRRLRKALDTGKFSGPLVGQLDNSRHTSCERGSRDGCRPDGIYGSIPSRAKRRAGYMACGYAIHRLFRQAGRLQRFEILVWPLVSTGDSVCLSGDAKQQSKLHAECLLLCRQGTS